MSVETKVTHTPGPWEARVRGKRWVVQRRGKFEGRSAFKNAMVLWDVANGIPMHDNTAEGNARLIAAAPDLFDALKSAVAYARLNNVDPRPPTSEQLHRWEAAIAKAEGKPESELK